jgi:RimJ/RimL family protein N-acetyltransferase
MMFDQITNLPTIEAERFMLRPLRKSDAGLLQMHSGDKRVARATKTMPHPMPPGAAEAYIARSAVEERDDDIWAMDGSGNGHAELMGLIWLTRMDRDQSEVTFWVAPAFWNGGIASEGLSALIAANPHQSKTMFAEVFQDNPASARVLTNQGFAYLGDAEAFSVARGAAVPTWTYVKKLAG